MISSILVLEELSRYLILLSDKEESNGDIETFFIVNQLCKMWLYSVHEQRLIL